MKLPRFILIISLSYAFPLMQEHRATYFNHKGIEGVILRVDNVSCLRNNSAGPLSIDEDEVLHIDSLALKYIIKKASKRPHLIGGWEGCPKIPDSWLEYYRQVVAYRDINTNHEMVLIRYIHKSEVNIVPNWKTQWVKVSGGCTNYVTIVYDKTKKKIIQWAIN
jgi:hypothetical protein